MQALRDLWAFGLLGAWNVSGELAERVRRILGEKGGVK